MMSARLPRLEDLSRLVEHRGLKRLLAWRDDRNPGPVGGAKARNLRRQLASAKHAGCDTLLITARAGSNLVMAASLMAPSLGFRVCCVLRPQPDSLHARHNLAVTIAAGSEIIPVSLDLSLRQTSPKMLQLRNALERAGRRIYHLGFSGGETEAGLAHLHAFAELAHTTETLGMDPPEAIYMAAASFASGAGVACGIAQHRWPTRLVLVNVAQDEPPNCSDILSAVTALADHAPGAFRLDASPELEIQHCLAPEFGRISAADAGLVASFGDVLALDSSYTAKAFAALMRDADANRIKDALFWHSGVGSRFWPTQLTPVDVPRDLATMLLVRPLEQEGEGP